MTGATGFIGSAVVRQLLERSGRACARRAGREHRKPRRAATSSASPCDVTDCNGDAPRAWRLRSRSTTSRRSTRRGCPTAEIIYRVNVEGTVATLLAAQHAKMKRVVYTSSHRRDRPRRRRPRRRDDDVQSLRHRERRTSSRSGRASASRCASPRRAAGRRRESRVPVRPARHRADAHREDHPRALARRGPRRIAGRLLHDRRRRLRRWAISSPKRRGASASATSWATTTSR